MGKIFPGFLVGVGLGIVFAPMSGQETRQLLAERVQKLRGQLPEKEQLARLSRQASDSAQQTSNTLKNVVVQVKGTVSSQADKMQHIRSEKAQTEKDKHDTSSLMPSPLAGISADTTPPEETIAIHTSIAAIPGMEPEIQKALEIQGVGTLQQLLERTPNKQERTNLAHKAGLNAHRLKTLSDRADLMRLQGVNGDIATMFEEAGINGCKDLQNRNPEHLHATLTELYEKKQIAVPPPEYDQLLQWIAEAMGVTVVGE